MSRRVVRDAAVAVRLACTFGENHLLRCPGLVPVLVRPVPPLRGEHLLRPGGGGRRASPDPRSGDRAPRPGRAPEAAAAGRRGPAAGHRPAHPSALRPRARACRSSPPCGTPAPCSTSTAPPRREVARRTSWPRMVEPPFFPISHGRLPGRAPLPRPRRVRRLRRRGHQGQGAPVPHIGHTLGFRIEADGRSLAYISDHQAPLDRRTVDKPVLELCDGADLVIHDAQYTDEEFVAMSDWGHSTADLRRAWWPARRGPSG